MPCFTGRRASSRSYVVFWVSPKWSHSFPGRHRSPLGLAPFVIDTPSVDVMGHARQASSTYARFDRLDIASGGRQRPSHFHPIVDTHPHTHTPIFSTQSSLVVTHAYAVGTGSPQRESRCSLVFWQKHNLAPKGLVGGDAILGTQVMSWGGLDFGCGTLSHSRWQGATVKERARVWDPS